MSSVRRYFGTDGIRGRVGEEPITAEFALKLGWAVGQYLAKEGKGAVLIGKDPRISGFMLAAALEAGLTAAGFDVHLLGNLPTPGVAYLTQALGAQLGIVVSASHNPYYDNGIKFFRQNGRKLPDQIEHEIESLLVNPLKTVDSRQMGRAQLVENAALRYIDFCKKSFLPFQDLTGLKIVLDCANGATSHIAPHVFAELGADVVTIHAEPDGFNINQDCGSTHPQNCQQAVLTEQAHLGIAFDGDGDRVIFIDNKGELVDGDELVYIIGSGLHAQGKLMGGVVGTQMSNFGLENAFKDLQIPFKRTQVGDRYVMDGLIEMGWQVGGESSGHIICLDKTSTGDGIISALQVLAQCVRSQKSLQDLKKGMTKCAQVLLNVPVSNGMQVMQNPKVLKAHQAALQQLENKGRILLRPSGTEPVVRVMVEGEDPDFIAKIAEQLAEAVQNIAAA